MYLVFKTTCVDRRIPLREGAFFFTRTMLFPPLNKRNTRDKARGLCITSERYIGELGVRCLSTLNRGQDSMQQSLYTIVLGEASDALLWSGETAQLKFGEQWFCFSVGKAVFLMPKGSTLTLPWSRNAVLLHLLVVPIIRYRNKKKLINRTN